MVNKEVWNIMLPWPDSDKHECENSIRLETPIRYIESTKAEIGEDGKWLYIEDNFWVAGEDYECITHIVYCPYCGVEL